MIEVIYARNIFCVENISCSMTLLCFCPHMALLNQFHFQHYVIVSSNNSEWARYAIQIMEISNDQNSFDSSI